MQFPVSVTEQEKRELSHFIKTSKDGHETMRALAVLRRAEGYNREEIAQFLGVKKESISDWITQFRRLGIAGLRSKKQLGNHHKLTIEQKREIKDIVLNNTPQEVEINDEEFWDVASVRQLIFTKYHVRYLSDRSIHYLLAFIGLSYHQPMKVDQGRKEARVKHFEEDLKKRGMYIKKILSS